MELILQAFLFFLPAGIANMTPIFAARLPGLRSWSAPIDFRKTYAQHRLLGDSKTWRGLLSGTLMAGLSAVIIQMIWPYGAISLSMAFTAGCLMGFGALTGDAVESFFKRQRGIAPGSSWFPFDQIDYIIGGLLFIYPLTLIPILLMSVILVIYFGLHLLTSYIGYLMGLKQRPI